MVQYGRIFPPGLHGTGGWELSWGGRSFAPLILFAASPGTITGVITLAVAHSRLELPITALVAVTLATRVMWLAMVLMARGGTRARGGLMSEWRHGSWV